MASTPPSLADLSAQMSQLLGRRGNQQLQLNDWMSGTATGGPRGDGYYPLTNGSGEITYQPSPAKALALGAVRGPEFFGAYGDGKSHPAGSSGFATLAALQAKYPFAVSLMQEMDFLAWQLMVNTTGNYFCPVNCRYVFYNSDPSTWMPLSWCAGVAEVDGNFGAIDCTKLRYVTNPTHYMDNWNFANASGWDNSHDYDAQPDLLIKCTFDKGYARGVDDKGYQNARNPYYEFSHPVTLAPGRYRAILKGTGTRGVSFKFGNGNPAYCTMHFRGITGRSVTVFPSFDLVDPENVEVPFTGQFDFEVTSTASGGIVFKGGGYLNVKVTSMDIVQFVPNSAILHHRDGPVEHYFLSRRLKNMNIYGPPNFNDRRGISLCIWKSFSSIDGSLQDWEKVKIQDWDITLNWQDGAYLLNYFMCDVGGADSGCYFGPGSVNAGENIKFMQGSISGGVIAMQNPGGAEFTLDGTIIDYNRMFILKNAGLIHIMNTRHEQHGPVNVNEPVIHCVAGGKVLYTNCYFLMAGSNFPTEPLWLDTTTSFVHFTDTMVYMLASATGQGSRGPGRVKFTGFVNGGNPNIGPDLISLSDNMDILGGAGLFEGGGGSTLLNTDASGVNLMGGIVVNEPTGSITTRWNSTYLNVGISTDYKRSGTRSLKITKTSGSDNNRWNQVQILIPIPSPDSNLLGVVYFAQPLPYTDPAIRQAYPLSGPPVYFRQFYVQVIGYDMFGRPILNSRNQFKGEDDLYFGIDGAVNADGSPRWIRKSLNTTYGPAYLDPLASDRTHAWATHYMLAIDCQVMPAGSIYMDDMRINHLG